MCSRVVGRINANNENADDDDDDYDGRCCCRWIHLLCDHCSVVGCVVVELIGAGLSHSVNAHNPLSLSLSQILFLTYAVCAVRRTRTEKDRIVQRAQVLSGSVWV